MIILAAMASPDNKNNNDTIDVMELLRKVVSKWYYFVLSLFICGALAFAYVQYADKKFEVASSIYVKGMDVGSLETGQLIAPNAKEMGGNAVALTNEIGKLTSYSLIKAAVEDLGFGITYYNVESFWPTFIREDWLNEIYNSFPYEVKIDSSANQLVNTPIFITALPGNKVRIYAKDDEASAHNFSGDGGGRVNDLEIDQVVGLDEPFKSKYVNITVSKKQNAIVDSEFDYCFKLITLHDLAVQYQGKVTVEPLNVLDAENRMLKLYLKESVPDKGVQFLNALIQTYSNENLSKKNNRGENSVEFLNKQIAQIRDSMNVAEEALKNLKSSSGILDIDMAKSSVVGNLTNLEQEKAAIQQRLNYYRNTLQGLKSSSGSTTIMAPSAAGINQDPLFNQLVQQYIEIATRLNKLKATATESNPLVTQLRTEAESVREAIVENLTSSINVEQSNLATINGRIASIRSNINTLPGEERKLQILQREYDNLVAKYNQLLDTKEKAQMSLATNTDNVEVIDAPKKIGYKPVEPNPALIFTVALAIGFMIPLGFVLIKDLTNNNIRDKKELETQTRAPLLGMIANGPKDAKLITQKYPNSAIAESFKFARVNLQYFHQNGNDKVIGVTSSISGEGKTFCSANLSATFAESGKRTILIGGDLRKPKIQDFFNLRGPGISEYASEIVSIDDIIQPTDIRNLDVISPGLPQEDPIRMFESAKMDELMAELKRRYDTIIVETPPIGYVADYFVLLKHFDINLFVVRYNYTNKNILSGINDLYVNNKIKNLYLLFNDVKFSAEYGYGYLSNSDGYYTNTYVRKLNGKKGSIKNPYTS